MKQILFVLHDAQRGGAQLQLLHFLQWFKKNHSQPFSLLLEQDGPLADEFQRLGPVYYWSDQSALESILSSVKLIVGQTARSSVILTALSEKIGCPRIICICELSHLIRRLEVGHLLNEELADRYIAVSQAVKQNLTANYAIPAEHITVLYNGIPMPEVNTASRLHIRQTIRATLGIPEHACLVTSVGTMEWHKGTDILVATAQRIRATTSYPIYFAWVGDSPDVDYLYRLHYDISKLNLANIRFVGASLNPLDYVIAGDIFALFSREEALSNAMLEAASLSKPIICFDKAGGPQEFVESNAGIVVPYLDVPAVAEAITELANDPDKRQSLGAAGAARVRAGHTIELVGPQYASMFQQIIEQTAPIHA